MDRMLSLTLNEPLDYERLLDISLDELQLLKDECEVVVQELKGKIIKEYESIKPALARMQDMRQKLRRLKEKRDVYKMFLRLDRNEDMLSVISTATRSTISVDVPTQAIPMHEFFREIDDELVLEPPPPPTSPYSPEKSASPPPQIPTTPRRAKSPGPAERPKSDLTLGGHSRQKSNIPILKGRQ
jgi:hypothetical protein